MIVENKPGAGGGIGTRQVATAPADGYTLMVGTNATHAANNFLYKAHLGNPLKDFKPIAMIGTLPLVFVTKPGNPINSMKELASASVPGGRQPDIAISTNSSRMAYELFHSKAEGKLLPIDYKGSAQAVTDLMGGHVEYMVDTIASLRPFIEKQQIKALGVTSARGTELLPNVASLAEQGIAGYELVGWNVLYTPAGIPAEAEKALREASRKVLQSAEVKDKLLSTGIQPLYLEGRELDDYLKAEYDKWGRLIDAAGLKGKL